MTEMNITELNLERDWKKAVRLVTYRRIFHSEGERDVPNHVRGITQDPQFQLSVEEVIAFSIYALSKPDDLGEALFNLKPTWDERIRKFLKELVSELNALQRKPK